MAESGSKDQHDGRQQKAKTAAGIADDKARLRTEFKATLAELADLHLEIERLASCKHSPGVAEEGACGECGAEIRRPQSTDP
jgi:hypothetical protein